MNDVEKNKFDFDFDNTEEFDGGQQIFAASGADTPVFEWTYERITTLGVSMSAVGNVQHGYMNEKDVMDHLILINESIPSKQRYSLSAVRAARDQVLGAMTRERLAAFCGEISYVPNPNIQKKLVELLRVACSEFNEFTPEECAKIILKFIWQIRRKLHGIKVERHVMPVIVGRQGSGKSEFIFALCRCVAEVLTNTNLAMITDDRNIDLFKNFIGVIDELDKADKTSVESLKAVITADIMDRRPMRENSTVKVKQCLTFIGTANKDISEVIIDETGNRRFVQINVVEPEHENSKKFWAMVNSFDWLSLWRSVDEHAADPTSDILDKIRQVQNAERSKSAIEMWIDTLVETNHPYVAERGLETLVSVLFKSFSDWSSEYGGAWKPTLSKFAREMKRMTTQKMIPFEPHPNRKAGTKYVSIGVAAAVPSTPAEKLRAEMHKKIMETVRRNDESNRL